MGCVLDDGIPLVLGEGHASVGAVGDALLFVIAVSCVHGDDGVLAEAGSIGCIDDGRTREDVAEVVGFDGDGLFLPVEEVGGGGMSP